MNKKYKHITEREILGYFSEKLTSEEKYNFKKHIIECNECSIKYINYENFLDRIFF